MANPLYPRVLEAPIERDLSLYPVVALMGARQVGKSTLARQIAQRRGMAYCTLDDMDVRRQAKEDPAGLLSDLGNQGALIDEAQRAPELFLAIKAVVDIEQRTGRYLLSGSSQPKMRDEVGDSLVGRANYRTMRPLITSELRLSSDGGAWSGLFGEEDEVLEQLTLNYLLMGDLDWREVVTSGGYPRVVTAPHDAQRELAASYLETFLGRDLAEVLHVASPGEFDRFLRLLATRIGQELNLTSMASDLGANPTTLRRWFDALERSYLVERIPAFYRNPGQRVIKSPKVFFNDTALALIAAGETKPTGFHLENLLATDLKVWEELAPGRRIYHWRTQSQIEVDFVLEQDRRLVGVEVKGADRIGASDARHLKTFLEQHGAKRGVLLSGDPDIRVLTPGIVAAPWWTAV